MELALRGQTVVVTGCTAGIGFAAAKLFASEGARVIVNGRTQARVSSAIDRIRVEHALLRDERAQRRSAVATSPEELANVIVYLASTAASATNGAAARVDGGVVRSIV